MEFLVLLCVTFVRLSGYYLTTKDHKGYHKGAQRNFFTLKRGE
jgi:hypothetical protein